MAKDSSKKKRIRNPEITRERLLQATVDLIAEKGVDALSMKEAAGKAGVSRSVAYLHFEDRDELLMQAKSWIKSRLQNGVSAFDENASLHERVLYTTRLVMQYPEISKVMIMDALASGELGLTDPLYQSVLAQQKKAIDLGALRADLDPEISTYIHLGSIVSSLLLLEQHPKEDVDILAERFTTEWCHFLGGSIFTR